YGPVDHPRPGRLSPFRRFRVTRGLGNDPVARPPPTRADLLSADRPPPRTLALPAGPTPARPRTAALRPGCAVLDHPSRPRREKSPAPQGRARVPLQRLYLPAASVDRPYQFVIRGCDVSIFIPSLYEARKISDFGHCF